MFSLAGSPARPTFTCSCGSKRCDRLVLKRPSGGDYTTEFVYCAQCRTVFHWPGEVPVDNSPMTSYGLMPDSPHPALQDPEFMARIEAAADRARKSRRSRR